MQTGCANAKADKLRPAWVAWAVSAAAGQVYSQSTRFPDASPHSKYPGAESAGATNLFSATSAGLFARTLHTLRPTCLSDALHDWLWRNRRAGDCCSAAPTTALLNGGSSGNPDGSPGNNVAGRGGGISRAPVWARSVCRKATSSTGAPRCCPAGCAAGCCGRARPALPDRWHAGAHGG